MPNEAEWEYAAVGGSKSKGYFYSGSDNWKEVSWSEGNSGHRTHPVGEKKPNEIGNDMKSTVRGDSNGNPASNPRQSGVRIERNARYNNIGFRIVKTK